MSDTKKPDATVEAPKTDDAAATAAAAATVDAGKKNDENVDHAANERTRIEGITTCEEAKGRADLANHFAFKTTMSVDDAKVALAAAPKGDASAASALDAAMAANGGGPAVANNGGDEEESASKDDGGLLGAYASATGNKAVLRVVK